MTAQPETIEGTAIVIREEAAPARADAEFASPLWGAARPADKLANATEVANVLKDVLVQRNLVKKIKNSEHVELEGWQTLGTLCGVSAKVVSTTQLEDGSWEARAVVVRVDNGVEIAAGESMCSRDESRWSGADAYAVRSMAQTRAMSRALRGVLAWIIVLAGYSPTPLEEIPPGGFDDRGTKPGARREDRKLRPVAGAAKQVTTAKLKELAEECGIPSLGEWLEENVAYDLSKRRPKILTATESIEAKRQLEELRGALARQRDEFEIEDDPNAALADAATEPAGRGRPPSDRQKGMLFALHTDLGHKDPDRHALYIAHCGKKSFTELDAADVAKLIDILTERR